MVTLTSPAQLGKYFLGVVYPATRQELVDAALENGAPEQAIKILETIEDEVFDSPMDVIMAYGEME